jgi:hypothetical protein
MSVRQLFGRGRYDSLQQNASSMSRAKSGSVGGHSRQGPLWLGLVVDEFVSGHGVEQIVGIDHELFRCSLVEVLVALRRVVESDDGCVDDLRYGQTVV